MSATMVDPQPSLDGDRLEVLPAGGTTLRGTAASQIPAHWTLVVCECGATYFGDTADRMQWRANHKCQYPWPSSTTHHH